MERRTEGIEAAKSAGGMGGGAAGRVRVVVECERGEEGLMMAASGET